MPYHGPTGCVHLGNPQQALTMAPQVLFTQEAEKGLRAASFKSRMRQTSDQHLELLASVSPFFGALHAIEMACWARLVFCSDLASS